MDCVKNADAEEDDDFCRLCKYEVAGEERVPESVNRWNNINRDFRLDEFNWVRER